MNGEVGGILRRFGGIPPKVGGINRKSGGIPYKVGGISPHHKQVSPKKQTNCLNSVRTSLNGI